MRKTWGFELKNRMLVGAAAALAGCGAENHRVGSSDTGNNGANTATLASAAPAYPADRPTGGDFTAVTDTYGPLVVTEGETEAESAIKPWSAYWYPINKPFLFQGASEGDSPLEKYDAFARKSANTDPQAAAFERQNIFQPEAETWAGLCDAWALASIMSPEPRYPLRVQDIEFKVGDLKALLLKTYDGVTGLKKFGQRNDNKWDSNYGDLYPEQFHRFLQVELFGKKMPFIMDYDPGIEVWNTPVWRAQIRITSDAARPDVRHVKLWLFTASPHVSDVNYVGTLQMVRDYEYDLFGVSAPDGSFQVTYGEWTGRSKWDHPDFVIERPEQLDRKSLNPKIDPSIVDNILSGGNGGHLLFTSL